MPEVQKSTQSGEMAQRFIELVMMQAQQAALFLGRIPNPETGKGEVNLEYARMFIDQLEMLQDKTRGNLSAEESQVLGGVLSDLRLAFVQASGAPASTPATSAQPPAPAAPQAPSAEPAAQTAAEPEGRKKFSKSYGS
jgi:hypothetical protein